MYKKLAVLLFIIIIILGGFYYLNNKKNIAVNQITPTPTRAQENDWKEYSFEKIGLKLSAPPDLEVSEDSSDDMFTLTIQRSNYPKPDYYQLYATFNLSNTDNIDKEGLKSDMNESSVEETTIDGKYSVKGQYKGERNRFVTKIVLDKGIFTIATSQPTEKNRELTESILRTFYFY